ncbi:MAG: HAMP domain-containing histidine kinase, partial [Holophagales bacterium]|nr:HAMP domain-containing histidine kinase [Holophagales bacterium]
GELEAVALVVRQLGAILATRRLMEVRLGRERRMAEQERLSVLGLVAASLAHEVKNPLSSMKVLAQALREDLASDAGGGSAAEGVADLDAILEQIDRLSHTTHEILGLARPRPGAVCDLHALAESAVYVLRAEARRRGVELVAELEEVGEVPGSAAAWQTVIFNLVSNAIHHSPTGSRISVRLSRPRSEGGSTEDLEFVVGNPAPELDDGPLDAFFEPFRSHGGTGLGLALVARRAEELGARVDGRAEKGRAVFRARLPAAGIDPPSEPAPPPTPATPEETRP